MNWGRRFFDPQLDLIYFEHPPSTHLTGGRAHLIRESAHYAYGLLLAGDTPAASRILARVLEKQNLDSAAKLYGGFTVEYEQEWATWSHPDENWAQFLGNILGLILAHEAEAARLSPELRLRVETAFRRCVEGTLRRNVSPSYTNIALLSAAVAAQGEFLFQLPGAKTFADRKTAEVVTRIRQAGSFDEYLSPTYYGTNLDAIYSLRRFSSGQRAADADELLELTWRDIEAAYHPSTYQLGGPHSRAYGDNLLDYAASLKQYLFLALGGDYPLAAAEVHHSHDNAFCMMRSRNPVSPRPKLTQPKATFRKLSVPDQRKAGKNLQLRQYSTPALHLGSISEQDEWIQRRNLLAYWPKAPGCGIGMMKGYFRHDEQELKSARFFSVQSGSAVLAAIRAPKPTQGESRYRLVFTERAQWSRDWLTPGSGPLVFGGMQVAIQSAVLPDRFGAPIWERPMGEYSTEVMTELHWRWPAAAKADQYVVAAFVLAFRPADHVSDELVRIESSPTGDALAFVATVGGEQLKLDVPV